MQTQKKHSDVLSKRKPKSSLVTGQLFGKISLMALGMTSPSEEINKVPIPCLELFKAPSKYIFHVEDPSSTMTMSSFGNSLVTTCLSNIGWAERWSAIIWPLTDFWIPNLCHKCWKNTCLYRIQKKCSWKLTDLLY